ncbi:hypothetical protein DU508_14280 [Pedobacter chinensis]|uniref:Uncharacterized protein n=1 Tax=Pedobacter chinensis TaxID=2282421 RepID=A0A369PT36_9SPHI|nr:hypothetical protein [Pedobacter chinensis]RDC55452.1 hypothetical protein DU508_14280 [Pedobacter chinensis]
MKKLLILVMACYGLNARSQMNDSKDFLYLYSDSTIYANRVTMRPDFSGTWSLRADSRRIPLEQVKFFNNEDGFYANTRKVDFFNSVSFAERIIEGKINLYQEVSYNSHPFDDEFYRFQTRRRQAVNTRMFYNKHFADLKKVTYNNLIIDMADRSESIDLLKGYRKSMRIGTAMYIGAGAAIIASAITLFANSGFKQIGTGTGNMPIYKNDSSTGSFLLMGLGGGLGIGGFLIQSSGSKNIERAIDAYNR